MHLMHVKGLYWSIIARKTLMSDQALSTPTGACHTPQHIPAVAASAAPAVCDLAGADPGTGFDDPCCVALRPPGEACKSGGIGEPLGQRGCTAVRGPPKKVHRPCRAPHVVQ